MATNTPNYGLKKPEINDFYNFEDQNGNMDIIDEELAKLQRKTDAAHAASHAKGGSDPLTPEAIGAAPEMLTGTAAPTTSTVGTVGQMYLNTSTGETFVCTAVSGSTYTWKKTSATPVYPQVAVTVESGSSVTCTDGTTTLTAISDGTATFIIPNYGDWTLSASLSGQSSNTATITVDSVKQYKATLSYFSATLNVTTSAGATVTATSGSNTFTATANGSGVATLAIKQPGTYSVMATQSGQSVNGSVSVMTSGGTYSLTLLLASTTLNNNSWAKIGEISDAGTGANYWSVGDTKTITISGTVGNTKFSNLSIDAFILGFDHNGYYEGGRRIHFQIGKISGTPVALIDEQCAGPGVNTTGYFSMTVGTNNGGWASSQMRTAILESDGTPPHPAANTLLAALPAELRAVMKACTKYSDNTGGGPDTAGYVSSTTDYLFLLSEFEYHGGKYHANSAEQHFQAQYAYYRAGNLKLKYKHNATGAQVCVWCRSVATGDSSNFCCVSTDGSGYCTYAGSSWGVAPGFCV